MDLAEQHGLKGRFVVGYIGTHGMAHALEKVLDVALVHLNDRAFHAGCAASSLAAASRYSRERQARNVLKVAQEVANGNGRTVGVGELA